MTLDDLERMLRTRDDVVIGTGVDDASVADAERELEVPFPSALRDYLTRFGHLELGHFELFGLGNDVPDYLNLVKMTRSERADPGCPVRKDLVPLLNDGGGNLYCIGTSQREAGKIFFWDHAGGPAQDPDEHASSFAEWVAELLGDLSSRRS